MKWSGVVLATLALASTALAKPTPRCSPVVGDFYIDVTDLNPEGAAWDPKTCKLYLSSIYNLTLVEFDPYTNTSKIIDLPGISNEGNFTSTEYHGNGIDYDYSTGHIFYALSSTGAFTSSSSGTLDFSKNDLTQPNQVWVYDPVKQKFAWSVDLLSAQQSFYNKTGFGTSGFQDIAEDKCGNSYAVGTFGATIMKIDHATKQASLWWSSSNNTDVYGLGGIFIEDDVLVVSDTVSEGLISFNLNDDTPTATYISLQDAGAPDNYKPMADGLFAPKKYSGKIALWSDDYNGTSVFGSQDQWKSAQYLGLATNPQLQAGGGLTVATFDIGNQIFAVPEYFQFTLPQARKDSYPIVDITDQVDALVKEFLGN